ncbi:hypothetical protein [Pontixanthobacter sp. CEM42]|uniref:hypothetical protein n=1 Tax=Pontixanthobacter sp. CEM42 TaxID=2792077 RepID=UPI001ADFFB06|nr:hypothetical protein [Pontixanthobacter sp. CEM42]
MANSWLIGMGMTLGFLVFFAGLWLLVTKLLVRMSGWAKLEEAFPDQPHDRAVEKWSAATGTMGRSAITGVNFRNCLRVEACDSGLRIKIWKILAPFSEPIFVPWSQISAEDGALGTTLLGLGNPEKGCLRIGAKFGRKLEAASRGQFTTLAG